VSANEQSEEVIRWRAYPSWNQFAWLYFFSMGAALRGVLALRVDLAVAGVWLTGAALLLSCAALLHHWARFVLTSRRVLVQNGYTGQPIEAMPLEEIEQMTVVQGPFARFLGIGTVVLRGHNGESILLRGVHDPENVKTRIEALKARAL
jgi:membrane protein YdbS with pleckstrin-like domain